MIFHDPCNPDKRNNLLRTAQTAVGECLRKYVAVYRFCTLNNKENC